MQNIRTNQTDIQLRTKSNSILMKCTWEINWNIKFSWYLQWRKWSRCALQFQLRISDDSTGRFPSIHPSLHRNIRWASCHRVCPIHRYSTKCLCNESWMLSSLCEHKRPNSYSSQTTHHKNKPTALKGRSGRASYFTLYRDEYTALR